MPGKPAHAGKYPSFGRTQLIKGSGMLSPRTPQHLLQQLLTLARFVAEHEERESQDQPAIEHEIVLAHELVFEVGGGDLEAMRSPAVQFDGDAEAVREVDEVDIAVTIPVIDDLVFRNKSFE